ncbi:Metal resistance protein YCF1, partial [Smittium culicis]
MMPEKTITEKSLSWFAPTYCPHPNGWEPFGGKYDLDFNVCFQLGYIQFPIQLTLSVFIAISIYILSKKPYHSSKQPKNIRKIKEVHICALALAIVCYHYNTTRSDTNSRSLQIYWITSLILSILHFYTEYSSETDRFHITFLILYFAEILLTLTLFVFENINFTPNRFTLTQQEYNDIKDNEKLEGFSSIEDRSNLFSMLSFSWLNPIVSLSSKKQLTILDLFVMPKLIQTIPASLNFWVEWKKEIFKKSSLTMALTRSFGWYYFFAAVLKLAQDILQFCQPLLLKKLLSFIESYNKDGTPALAVGFYYAFSMLLFSILQSFTVNQYFNVCMLTSVRVRSALVSAIYKKSLVLNNKSLNDFSTGEIVNRMAVDTERISDAIQFCHILWSGPLQILISIYLLFNMLGWSSIAGSAMMFFIIPLNSYYAKKMATAQLNQMKFKDKRIKTTNETLENIKLIKLLSWEEPFLDKIRNIRNNYEIKNIYYLGYYLSVQTAISFLVPILVTLATFAVYVKFESNSRGPLNSSIIFSSLTLFNLLKFPILVFPRAIYLIINAIVSVRRINSYLNSEEINEASISRTNISSKSKGRFDESNSNSSKSNSNTKVNSDNDVVSVTNASLWWKYDPSSSSPTLNNISFSAKQGELVAVSGITGAGKSSLLISL